MQHIEFALQVAPTSGEHTLPSSAVAVYIDERSLMDLVLGLEVAAGRVPPGTAKTSRYRWMSASVAANPLHWLGQPRDREDESYLGHPYVLNCVSGFAGDCGLYAVVVPHADRVSWASLGVPGQVDGSLYAALGPYEFDRRQYESALESVRGT